MKHNFVQFIPDTIEAGTIYISIDYATAVHKCVCGCGNEVVTPLSPTDWSLTFNGVNISLYPSIGNWSFECQSHYWIKKGKIIHCSKWDSSEVKSGRKKDKNKKNKYYKKDKIMNEENKPFTKEELLKELKKIADPATGLVSEKDLAQLVYNFRFPKELSKNADKALLSIRNDFNRAALIPSKMQSIVSEIEKINDSTEPSEINRKNELTLEFENLDNEMMEIHERFVKRVNE